jgi:2-methylcitrate dehydratase PrpD
MSLAARLAEFVVSAKPPAEAARRAATAFLDTIGVILAGVNEPASRAVRGTVAADGGEGSQVLGTSTRTTASNAALANGTAAHALDFDDMCFVSLAHPSAPLVPAAIAAAEVASASGPAMLDAYVAGFEVECLLGRLMNPRHYQRGWHCTSTIGTIGAAAACSRLLGLDADEAAHALAIAASEASGFKENFGSMVKPLHAGLAARNGVLAATLARAGLAASARALEGPQGFLAAMDSQHTSVTDADVAGLGRRWEIVETGITVKLYPSCAGTHPSLDAVLDLRRREGFTADRVDAVEIEVDSITPTVLIYERPGSALEGKFSMPFCVAAALVEGRVGIDTFEPARLTDATIAALMPRVRIRVNKAFDGVAPPLTQANVTVRLRDGRVLTRRANGARGYPERPASDQELDEKFLGCATRVLTAGTAQDALGMLREIESVDEVRDLSRLLRGRV